MEEKKYSRIGERMFHTQLPNGLHIYVSPKPGFQKSYAFFATNYGGMDMRFELDGQWLDTPAGVAHFLEHKTFDTEDGNALQDLAANGASPNAFTSTALTGYYFESTEKFEENLKILLSFVSIPYYTQESVDKEQGIIGQEIRMGDDEPDTQVFYGMLEGLYAHNPVKENIAGTVESIAQITAETLNLCHKAFYDPGNMVLCVAGDVDPERIAAIAQEILPKEGHIPARRDYGPAEGERAAQSRWEKEMAVSTPIFQLGFKDTPPEQGEAWLRWELLGDLACEALLGTSSPLYAKLYGEGLVNEAFSYGCEAYPGAAFLCAGGESRDPEAVREAVLAEAKRIGREGIDEGLFRRLKRAAYGSLVRGLNSFENLCVSQSAAHFHGYSYLTFPEVFETISKSNVEACICRVVTEEKTALAVIKPKGGAV
ncbi:EF-P 5-aminopentanol modification-associated protein YfmH [Vermiculatibacterium agrestimuris]|uniref:EF-P 5-aminopentanol modification-associated protein YfmH n=1 Tax=Vermiculatibacterium agrestimuris TaxID=2941519 RepID=UPI00203BEA93|nr:pitrilysin family protein [Vermiculatibacterium agrestimuris]